LIGYSSAHPPPPPPRGGGSGVPPPPARGTGHPMTVLTQPGRPELRGGIPPPVSPRAQHFDITGGQTHIAANPYMIHLNHHSEDQSLIMH
jgi:hypothetical protein